MAYDFKEIEKKWIPQYEEFDGYKGIDFENDKEKFYMLTEFPYPSGSGLHVGHAFAMTAADVYARFQRMQGKNVMFPMGWDAFGLPAENYAIKTGRNPKEITKEVTDMFRSQMKKLGFSFDWDREINSTSPDYYKWTQWIFTKLFEEGLAEKKEMPINWCPKDKIGLANEEVIDGKCERCGTEVEKRTISQWVVKITDYADRLINGLYDTEFIEKVKAAQINWIGKKEGAKIRFEVKGHPEKLEVFTTRPDTIAGATFMVIAPEHALVGELLEGHSDNVSRVKEYLENIKGESEMQRTDASREKTGVFSGLIAINPITNKEIPIWIADYVTMSYGTGAIMAVPSHDDRDGEFAQKFGLEINETYTPDDQMMEEIEKRGMGEKAVTYHLRDWIFSRQHYWGEPIPMVYCERDGWVSVPAVDLPVVLPDVEKYLPTDTGESPLANIKDWVETTCPKCGGKAKRETDTMPNWAGSSWYYLRYTDPKNKKAFAEQLKNIKVENKKIEREIILKNPEGQEGDYTEYENFFNAEGQIEKVNFWAFTAKKNTRELFLVEMDAKYDNGRLLSFMRHNVKEDGSFDSGEKCELFYDFSGQLIRLERKNIELNLKTIIYYSHNSKGFINSYSIDYLVGLRNGQNNQKQDIYFNCDRYGNWVKKYLIYDNKKHLEAKRIIKYYYDGFLSWQKEKE